MKINPYERLLEKIRSHCLKLDYRHTISMWYYPKEQLSNDWKLDTLYERVYAAAQLDYDVCLRSTEKGLFVDYVKKIPQTPSEWKK